MFDHHPLFDEFPWELTPYGLGTHSFTEAAHGTFDITSGGEEWSYQHDGSDTSKDTVIVRFGAIDQADEVAEFYEMKVTFIITG